MTRTPLSRSKGQRLTCRGGGILWRPPTQLVTDRMITIFRYQNWLIVGTTIITHWLMHLQSDVHSSLVLMCIIYIWHYSICKLHVLCFWTTESRGRIRVSPFSSLSALSKIMAKQYVHDMQLHVIHRMLGLLCFARTCWLWCVCVIPGVCAVLLIRTKQLVGEFVKWRVN